MSVSNISPRRIDECLFNRYYTRINGLTCWYCGDWGKTLDHVPPLLWVSSLGVKHFDEIGVRLVLVPCCGWCNGKLGARGVFTVRERAAFVYDALAKRRRSIRLADWNPDDVAGLGRSLRGRVERAIRQARALDERIAWAKDVATRSGIGVECP